jgi:endonuclease/exonuclease/phosphatase family metal-dependent hydrolase
MEGGSKRWATILSTETMEPLPDPHPASAAAIIEGVVVCASVLPWPLAQGSWHWGPAEHLPRMQQALGELTDALLGRPVVWGGDWNQPLQGSLAGFSRAARDAITASTEMLDLQVPTASLPARTPKQGSIDHLAVPNSWTVWGAGCVPVDGHLSDHYAYWVEATP